MLGPFEVMLDGVPLKVPGTKQRTLLAILALRFNTFVSSAHLVDLLWEQQPPKSALNLLHVYISGLRKILKFGANGRPCIVTRPSGYILEIDPHQLDAEVFTNLVDEGRRALIARANKAAALKYDKALALWRGDVLSDFRFATFAQSDIARYEHLRESALEDWAEAQLALGRQADLIPQLVTLVIENPLRERMRGQLMLALYREGQQAAALQTFADGRRILVQELGVEPGRELCELYEKILHQDAGLDSSAAEAPGTKLTNLPTPLSTFVGREFELRVIPSKFSGTRLVSLVGPVGCGKSRLAIEIGGRMINHYSDDGIWWADLSDVIDPALVPERVASALGIHRPSAGFTIQGIVQALEQRAVLLILDNCEHLLETCAGLVDQVLLKCKDCQVLVTSRTALQLPDEYTYHLKPLELPDDFSYEGCRDNDAVRLFCDRAAQVFSNFALTQTAAPVVGRICARLDGLPLSIELAAARLGALSLEEVESRLDGQLRLLSTGRSTVPNARGSLLAALDLSFEQLDSLEQQFFARTSVFTGGFTLEAAASVCVSNESAGHRVLDMISVLVNDSLVMVDNRNRVRRYRLLPAVRQYAGEKLDSLGERRLIEDKHAAFHLSFVEDAERGLHGPDQSRWLRDLRSELSNIRSALEWCLSEAEDAERAVRIAAAIWWFWGERPAEGDDWLRRGLSLGAQLPVRLRAKGLLGRAALNFLQGAYREASVMANESLALAEEADEASIRIGALHFLGSICRDQGAYERSNSFHQEGLAAARRLGDDWLIGRSFYSLALLAEAQGLYERSARYLNEANVFFAGIGDSEGMGEVAYISGELLMRQEDWRAAALQFNKALSGAREREDREQIACLSLSIASAAVHAGERPFTYMMLDEAFIEFRRLGMRLWLAKTLECMAHVSEAFEEYGRAATLLGVAECLRDALSSPPSSSEAVNLMKRLEALKTQLGDEAATVCLAIGKSMSVDEAFNLFQEQRYARASPRTSEVPPATNGQKPSEYLVS